MPNTTIQVKCDPETGLCEIPDFTTENVEEIKWEGDTEIIYVGDPMCSWCWGISPQLNALERYGKQQGIPFRLVLGGLRGEGDQAWNQEFKDYLESLSAK